jgi:hypothetical protein
LRKRCHAMEWQIETLLRSIDFYCHTFWRVKDVIYKTCESWHDFAVDSVRLKFRSLGFVSYNNLSRLYVSYITQSSNQYLALLMQKQAGKKIKKLKYVLLLSLFWLMYYMYYIHLFIHSFNVLLLINVEKQHWI